MAESITQGFCTPLNEILEYLMKDESPLKPQEKEALQPSYRTNGETTEDLNEFFLTRLVTEPNPRKKG